MQLANRIAHIKQRQQAGRVPSGTGGQLLAFNQGYIGPAFFGQMIERSDADHASANDNDPCCRFHGKALLLA